MSSRKSAFRVGAAAVIIGLAVTVYMTRPAANAPAPAGSHGQSAANTALPRLLDLGADKCVPCKMMAPILDELRQDYEGLMIVEFIDVWKNPPASEPYDLRVIPTQIFFAADGKELYRHEGFMGREDILSKWRELGVALPKKGA